MSQDTRKDPRAKVLTMTVRYKSATLDEFIEHHSYDVSRGGMFIKTPSPFPPGTLLKFEVKIAADQKVIQGVGRVVWKRDQETPGDARPAGMGVKFIKIDDASRKVIDTLVDSRGDGSSAYEAGGGDGGLPAVAAPAAKGAEGAAPKAPAARKATMIGLGAMNPSARPPVVAPAPAPPADKPVASFFPETNSQADMPPPEDRTVMKQAAELLQDALRGAGSSMDEVASTSKYADPPSKTPSKPAEPEAPAPKSEPPVEAKPASLKPASEKPVSEKPASVKPEAAKPASVKPLAAKPASAKPAAVKTTKSTIPAQRRAVAPAVPAATTNSSTGGGGRVVVIALVIAATAGLVYAFSNGKPPEPAPAPVVSAAPAPVPTPVPVASEAPATVDTAASAVPVDSAAPPASAATSASAAPVVVVPPAQPQLPTVATPKPAPVLNYRPVAKPKPKPVAEPSEPSSPEPTPPSEPSVDKPAAPAAPTTPAPTPTPKPAEPSGDNPY